MRNRQRNALNRSPKQTKHNGEWVALAMAGTMAIIQTLCWIVVMILQSLKK